MSGTSIPIIVGGSTGPSAIRRAQVLESPRKDEFSHQDPRLGLLLHLHPRRRASLRDRCRRTPAAVIRLVGAVHDDWQAGDRRYFSEGPMAILYPESDTDRVVELTPGD